MDPIRIIIHESRSMTHGQRHRVTLEDGTELGWYRFPLYDAARALQERGVDPDRTLAARWVGSPYDNFVPAKIGHLARWTISERHSGDSTRERWHPRPVLEGKSS